MKFKKGIVVKIKAGVTVEGEPCNIAGWHGRVDKDEEGNFFITLPQLWIKNYLITN